MSVRALCTLALLALVASSSGCTSTVPYTPNTNLVEDLGYQGAQQKFSELMTRARAPRIGDAAIDEKHFEVQLNSNYRGGWGWWGGGVARDGKAAFYHANVGRLDVYNNNKVFVIGNDEKRMVDFAFADQPDAFLFCDLVWSFRTYKGAGGGGNTNPPAGSGGSGGEERHSSNVMQGDEKGQKSGSGSSDSGSEERKSTNVLDPQ